MNIGLNIRILRKNADLSQEMLAEKLECSTRYISDIEQNNSKPSYEILVKFCNTFNMGMDEIFKEYLESTDKENLVSYELKGYENLKEQDKNTIAHLISFFNTTNK